MLEILTRTRLPVKPQHAEDVVRLEDLAAYGAEPTDKRLGLIWINATGEARLWTGGAWLLLGAGAPPSGDSWDGGSSWDDGTTTWG